MNGRTGIVAGRYGPGALPIYDDDLQAGDLIFVHRAALASRLIAFGQALRFRGKDREFAHWTHIACPTGRGGELAEALGHGVELTEVGRYRDVEFHHVRLAVGDADRVQMQRFLLACVGRPYGYTEILSLGLTLSAPAATGAFRFLRPSCLYFGLHAASMSALAA
jgi:hypothetical protein